LGAVRYLETSADGLSPPARDENDLIQKSSARLDIQQSAGADRGEILLSLRRWRHIRLVLL
jgi:hypothetical protein